MIGSNVFLFSDEGRTHLRFPSTAERHPDIQFNDTQHNDIQQNIDVIHYFEMLIVIFHFYNCKKCGYAEFNLCHYAESSCAECYYDAEYCYTECSYSDYF
jgi:hypothetical protein